MNKDEPEAWEKAQNMRIAEATMIDDTEIQRHARPLFWAIVEYLQKKINK
jgi:hypothetical protein